MGYNNVENQCHEKLTFCDHQASYNTHVYSGAQTGYHGVQLHVLSSVVGVWVDWWVYNWRIWIPNIMEYGKQITLLLLHKYYTYTGSVLGVGHLNFN
jgi:hypothetical protein